MMRTFLRSILPVCLVIWALAIGLALCINDIMEGIIWLVLGLGAFAIVGTGLLFLIINWLFKD
jgi:hypothetical protein